jgi:TRAP-type C4-dicarboxylate transport system substrate-binding protein
MTVRIGLALAGLALSALPAGAQTKWNLPAAYPADNYHTENIVQFAKEVEQGSGGKLTITVHPNASLFKAPEIKRAVQTGQAQAGEILMSIHENEDPVYGMDTVPFLATSFAQAKKLWAVQRPAVERKLASQGMQLLFAVPWPPQGMYTKKDVNAVEDLKGLKFRAYNPGTSRIADLVGGQPVTVQAAELPQALATGVVNAVITSAATGYDSKIWESLTHYYDAQAWIPKNMTIVSKAALDGLEPPVREAVLKAAGEAETRGWKLGEEKTSWYVNQLSSRGMKVLPPSQQLSAALSKIGEQLTADWLKRAGQDGQALLAEYRKQ